jgi:hypothetical protein
LICNLVAFLQIVCVLSLHAVSGRQRRRGMQEAGGNYFGVEKFKRKGQRESFDLCPARSFKDNWEGLKKFNNNPLSPLMPSISNCAVVQGCVCVCWLIWFIPLSFAVVLL